MNRAPILIVAAVAILSLGACATCQRKPERRDSDVEASSAGLEALNAQPRTRYTYAADAICTNGSIVTAHFRSMPIGIDGLRPGDRIRLVPRTMGSDNPCPAQRASDEIEARFTGYRAVPGGTLQFVMLAQT